ncbi:TonB-dependent receptor [Parapedomonas caeni]
MRMTKYLLLSTCSALMALAAAPALADDAAAAEGLEDIIVFGRGEARQVQEVQAAQLALETPGASPLKAVDKLPGVNFNYADAFGAYEWSTRITMRGFGQSQLGFTLDGVPLGDMSYGNHNGLHISRAISNENIGRIEVAQGAGALGTASTSNLGGTLQFFSKDPDADMGAFVSGTYGSENTWRGVVRLETGEIAATGTRAYLSYVYHDADKWKGEGIQRYQQANFKVVQPVGEGKLTGFLNWSDRKENDYQDMSAEMIGRLGHDWDNISDDWALAVAVANVYQSGGSVYPAPFTSVDDAYFDAAGLRKDWLGSLAYDTPIGDKITLRLQGYWHDNEGQGIWYTPYVATPGGAPISVRTTEYDMVRKGVTGSLDLELGSHTLTAGFWYEDNQFKQARRFYGLDDADTPSRKSTNYMKNPFYTQWYFQYDTDTAVLYLADTWKVADQLTINGGFKSIRAKIKSTALVATGSNPTAGEITAKDNFLPQLGMVYELNDDHQVFASFTKNMRAYTQGTFGTTSVAFEAMKDTLKPETSTTWEAGWRFRSSGLQGSLTAFYVDFKNRQLSIADPNVAQIVGAASTLANVGSVTSKGIEAAIDWKFADNWSAFASYAYTDATYEDDYQVFSGGTTVTVEVSGKTVVDAPKHLAKAELSYDDDNFFGTLSANYTSKRYYSYTNDASVKGRVLVDLTLGYRFSGSPMLEGLVVQGQVTNLFDKNYVSTVGSGGFTVSGDSMTLLPGSPRAAFITLKKQF